MNQIKKNLHLSIMIALPFMLILLGGCAKKAAVVKKDEMGKPVMAEESKQDRLVKAPEPQAITPIEKEDEPRIDVSDIIEKTIKEITPEKAEEVETEVAEEQEGSVGAGRIEETGLEEERAEEVEVPLEEMIGEIVSEEEEERVAMEEEAMEIEVATAEIPLVPEMEEAEAKTDKLLPIFFDFDRYSLKEDTRETLNDNAAWLKEHPSAKLLIEGHADERGSNEYNLALGDRRAKSVGDYLRDLGVTVDLSTVTFGEEKPVCGEHQEECWSRNRRAEFLILSE